MEQHEVPTISVAAILYSAGAPYDEGKKNGLAAFTADGLQHGTKGLYPNQIESN
jgi:predicted Zn-dependent peptidase